MIDVEEELFDELARLVYADFPGAYVSGENVEVPASFPAVSIVEEENAVEQSRIDSSGEENAAALTYTVNVYSDSATTAKRDCRAIAGIVDDRMRLLNFRRAFLAPVDNAADPSIYRLTARYVGLVTKDNVYHGR